MAAFLVTQIGGGPRRRLGWWFLPMIREPFGRAVLRLSRDPDLRHSLGVAAFPRVRQNFPMEKCVKAHEDLYEELLDQRR
jgi:glycosyltransferase involved in cell wall biosynthesis